MRAPDSWRLEFGSDGRVGLRSAHGSFLGARPLDEALVAGAAGCGCTGAASAASPVQKPSKQEWELWRPFCR